MSRLQPWADAKLPNIQENESIYINPPNIYGYQININHSQIRPLFNKWCKEHKIPPWCPLSDGERHAFEFYICTRIISGEIKD